MSAHNCSEISICDTRTSAREKPLFVQLQQLTAHAGSLVLHGSEAAGIEASVRSCLQLLPCWQAACSALGRGGRFTLQCRPRQRSRGCYAPQAGTVPAVDSNMAAAGAARPHVGPQAALGIHLPALLSASSASSLGSSECGHCNYRVPLDSWQRPWRPRHTMQQQQQVPASSKRLQHYSSSSSRRHSGTP